MCWREASRFSRSPRPDLPRQLAGKYSMFSSLPGPGGADSAAMLAWSPERPGEFSRPGRLPAHREARPHPGGTAGSSCGSTTIVRTPYELQEIWALRGRTSNGLPSRIHPPASAGLVFHGYFDTPAGARPAFTGVKDALTRPTSGNTSLGRAVPNSRLREQVTGMAAAIGFAASSTSTCASTAGRPVRAARLQPAPRGPVPAFDHRHRGRPRGPGRVPRPDRPAGRGRGDDAGTAFPGRELRPLGAIGYWRRGELGLRSWLRSLRQVDEVALAGRDDLRPFGLMCARMAWRPSRASAARSGARRNPAPVQSSAGSIHAQVRPRCFAPRTDQLPSR